MATLKRIENSADVTIENLKETHHLYSENVDEWVFLMAAYEGIKEIIKYDFIQKHERESDANWTRRKAELYSFEYTKSVVDLLNFYLFKKKVTRDLGKLGKDPLWELFFNDCNLYGDSFDDFLSEIGRNTSIRGSMGLLVDKPNKTLGTKSEQVREKVYPYIAVYHPTAILDWEFSRDSTNRPYLSYLKLLDDDGLYRVWYPETYEVWEVPTVEAEDASTGVKKYSTNMKDKAVLVEKGVNPLGFIPFIWVLNIKGRKRPIGVSDVHGVARLDLSIIRNLSQGEEIIDYAAFPMLMLPEEDETPGGKPQTDIEVGPTAVLSFPRDNPEAKPDWLETEVKDPIDALLKWIERKVSEIYRAVNVGGMSSMEVSTSPKSGAALKAEFQMLNAILIRKATNLEKAERSIIKFFLAWEGQEALYDNVSVERARTYDIEDLATDLENVLTAQIIVKSKTFNASLQKKIVRQMLPGVEEKDLFEMDKEIEGYIKNALDFSEIPIYDGEGGDNPSGNPDYQNFQ